MSSPAVHLVDDDVGIQKSLSLLLKVAGFTTRTFDSAEHFLQTCGADPLGCLILDVRMPGMGGIALQQEMLQRGLSLPIIFLTAYGEVPMTAAAMKLGAIDFLTKPVDSVLLLQCVQEALDLDRTNRQATEACHTVEARLARLTSQERKVLLLAITGLTSAEIGLQLNISPRTVEAHRCSLLQKTSTKSLLELAQLISGVGLALE